MRYKQVENFLITGPGLPEQGVVAVGVRELEAAYKEGLGEGYFCCAMYAIAVTAILWGTCLASHN